MSFPHSGLHPLRGGPPLPLDAGHHTSHALIASQLSQLAPLGQTATTSNSNGPQKKSHKKKKGPPEQARLSFVPPMNNMLTGEVSTHCDLCDYFTDKKDRMRRHIRTVHLREKPFHCDLCPLAFGRKDKLKRHVDTVHTVDKPFKCDFCGHASGRRDKLKYHVETTHLRVRTGAAADKAPRAKTPAYSLQNYEAEVV